MDDSNKDDKGEKNSFDQFQLEEYKNISNCHYETVKQISVFIRYYVLIIGAPFLIFNFIYSKNESLKTFFIGQESTIYYNIVSIYLFVISLIGFAIFIYIINLRHDAILYAKTVNKVRRYFYHKSDLDINEFEQFLMLPIVSAKPKYFEKTFFSPLLIVFSFINSSLIFSAFSLRYLKSPYIFNFSFIGDFQITLFLIWVITFSFFLAHFIFYYWLSGRRNTRFFRDYTFGVDIDGVVNDQTANFLKWIKLYTGKDIDMNLMKEIPVSLNKDIGITDFEEKLVFNTKEYWESLELKDNASNRIDDFHKKFGYKIRFFSYRDWPQYGSKEKEIRETILGLNYTPLEKNQIHEITNKWLKEKNINAIVIKNVFSHVCYLVSNIFHSPKKVIIEMGNPYVSDLRYTNYLRNRGLNKNRFQESNLKSFRFFIEDHPENAIKLASLCDYVFLLKEPYNTDIRYKYPKNVIKVENWNDIYRKLKSLS